mmetsp:Transcript_30562/g.62452  ORF Transcript_30562/g.62452 Transcript_30562/m.62452 type:complete len:89 (+) Transcript_30562:418-684(+)
MDPSRHVAGIRSVDHLRQRAAIALRVIGAEKSFLVGRGNFFRGFRLPGRFCRWLVFRGKRKQTDGTGVVGQKEGGTISGGQGNQAIDT